jgi:hypothetical protein
MREPSCGDSSKHGHAPRDVPDDRSQDFQFLGVFQRGIFSDRAQHDKTVNAGAKQSFHMLGRARQIKRLIVVELGRHRRIDTVPVCLEIGNGCFLRSLLLTFAQDQDNAFARDGQLASYATARDCGR